MKYIWSQIGERNNPVDYNSIAKRRNSVMDLHKAIKPSSAPERNFLDWDLKFKFILQT